MKNNNLSTFFSLQYLLLSLPFLIVTGPLLSDALVSLFAIYLLFQVKKILLDKQLTYFFLFFFAFYVLINISTVLSDYVNLNLNSIFYFRFFLFSFCFILIIENPNFFFKYLSIIIGFIFIILLIDGLSEFFFKRNILNYDNSHANRVSSLFKDELVLGSFTVRLLPILLGSLIFYLKKFKKYNDLILLFFTGIGISLIFLSGERTSILLFLSFLLFIFIFWETKLVFKFILISIIPIFFLLFLSENIRNRFLIEPLIQFNFINQKTLEEKNIVDDKDFSYPSIQTKKIYIFSVHHHRHYLAAWKIFKEYPLIGAGPKSFRVSCKEPKFRVYLFYEWEEHLDVNDWSQFKIIEGITHGIYHYYDLENQARIDKIYFDHGNRSFGHIKLNNFNQACSTHPHNTHIQILSELGLLGYVFLSSFIFMILYFSIKIKKDKIKFKYPHMKDLSIFLLGACFMNLWPIAPSGNFFNNWLSIFYYFPFGLLLYCFSQRVKKKNENISK